MADIASLTNSAAVPKAENSTSRSGNTELTMQDFLQLMVVQLQNQTMDNAMDTSEMMNQMVQMQMVTAITNMNELSVMTYASSLVGKVVTIGILSGNTLEEREVQVIGTGMSNGQQVIFGKDGTGRVETYALNQIMAIGHLPPIEGQEPPVEGGDNEGEEGEEGEEGTGPVEGTEGGDQAQQPENPDPAYDGTQGTPTGE